jgi:dolichol-phosphate mannosyltransferase
LLPAYNEEASIALLFAKIAEAMRKLGRQYRIVVCNDGSSDGTESILADYVDKIPLDILTHKINRGLGETVRDLFEYAAARVQPGDIVVRFDCDLTHDPETIGSMVEKIEEGYDVIIASRFAPSGAQRGVTPFRSFISRGANLFMKVFFPIKGLKEYTCGFRAYRGELIAEAVAFYGNNFIQLKGLGFTCTLEKLVKLNLLGAKFTEVPFTLRYDEKLSSSKMIASITTLGYIVMVIVHYWPWGGWRRNYRPLLRKFQQAERENNFANMQKNTARQNADQLPR